MFVKFDEAGKVAELWAAAPPELDGFLEVEAVTFENKDRARLVNGKVEFVDEAVLDKDRNVQQGKAELAQNQMNLRSQIDLAQSVAELAKKVDLVIQALHQLVLANRLKDALDAAAQQRYDETVAVFAEKENLMNLYDYQKTLQDLRAMYEHLSGKIQEYQADKAETCGKYGLTEQEIRTI